MRHLLDRVTGAVTMYALAIILLGAIGVIAVALSLLGALSYPALDLLASAAVSVGVTVGSSLVIARILRVAAHIQSAVITGLLVFFIMIPSLDPVGLLLIALTGLIASVSKYLIAVRGRHILNPASLGTFVVGVLVFSGLLPFASFPGWWVGTSALLIPVAIGAFLVLYRTQRLVLGGVFLALVIAIGFGATLVRGGTMLDGLSLTILSSPWVFFAGFMLTEPLTLPPRRWQQLTEAAIVAVLIPIPFALGPVTNTPQLALLVGNV
ncbi:MAG: oxidoreductase, partial [Salinibacterium sp.]|nr:oxidoreductase [Salinibacterium sp.]